MAESKSINEKLFGERGNFAFSLFVEIVGTKTRSRGESSSWPGSI